MHSANPKPPPLPSHQISRFVYVVNSIEETVSGFSIDVQSGMLTPVGACVATDDAPIYAAASPDGKFLYVANTGTDASNVSGYRINPSSGVSSRFLYVTCAGRGTIAEFTIDAVTGKLTAITPALSLGTGIGPRGIAVDASGSFVYTAFNTQNRAGTAMV